VLYLLFFLSGFTGLVYEIAWSRILSTILGNTSLAISVVVSIFLGGLALGSFISPRVGLFRKSPFKVYGSLEIFVAIYSAFTPWMAPVIDRIYVFQYEAVAGHFWLSVIYKAAITGVLFLLPAVAMGATLPVLVRLFIQNERAHGAGLLYGINTTGAVIGTISSGYFLLPVLGIKQTILLTAMINLVIGATAFLNSRSYEGGAEEPKTGIMFHPLYFLFFLTGFASLAYEILWTRALSMFFGSSVYAFSSILAAFLLGIASGSSYYAKRIPEKADPYQFFSLIQFRISLAAVFFVGVFMGIPFLLIRLFGWLHGSFALFQAAQFVLIGATIFYATFLSGAAFPAALHFFRNQPENAQFHVSNIYTVNTIGSILGSICAGFILIPTLGVERSIRLIGLLNLLLGIYCFRKTVAQFQERRVLAIGAVCFVLLLILPQWNKSIFNAGFYAFAYKYVPKKMETRITPSLRKPVLQSGLFTLPHANSELRLIYYGEGLTATVAVAEQSRGVRSLLINGKPDASNVWLGDMRTQLLLGHLPMLFRGRADRVLVIGLGSGVTAGAIATHRMRKIDCVEIEKKVADAARFFEPENLKIQKHGNFHLIFDDGRNFVRHTSLKYDVITSEPSNLWMSGVSNLFTREFFLSAKDRLQPGGIMCQWLHLYQISLDDVMVFLKTFHSVFPYFSVWIDASDMLILGTDHPLVFDEKFFEQRMSDPLIAWSLHRSAITPGMLMRDYVGHENMIKVLRHSIPLNLDDHPVLEFSAPKSLFVDDSAQIAKALAIFQRVADLNGL